MMESDLLGAGIALLAALSWALSTVILKTLTLKIDALSLNMIRLWVGSILLLGFAFLTNRFGLLSDISTSAIVLVIGSGVIAVAIGDTVYIKSLSLLDASKAFTIAQCTFPVLTSIVAIYFLGEAFHWITAAGAGLVVGGIYLISGERRSRTMTAAKTNSGAGVALALVAAMAWTAASISLKLGVLEMDTFVAAALRIPAAAIVLTLFVMVRGKKVHRKPARPGARILLPAAVAGVLTYGVAAVSYVTAIQMIGAAKTVLITASAPVLVLPLSIFVLKEKPDRLALAGILMCVVGIVCVTV